MNTPTQTEHDNRYRIAQSIVRDVATLALRHFRSIESLSIESKGFQDVVSNADKEVELAIRDALQIEFPEDGIIGEEFDNTVGTSGYRWVIDPIDGTANFVTGIPCWAVVLACVKDDATVIGVIFDPVAGELWRASRGNGAFVNDVPVKTTAATELSDGSTGLGFSNRVPRQVQITLLSSLISEGGIFYRNASGALMLAYVAGGRLIGYSEGHMNAWDCIAALLMIEEAGGEVESFSMTQMLEKGNRVIAAGTGVFPKLKAISDSAFAELS